MTRVSLGHTINHRDLLYLFRSSYQRCSVKKDFLKTFASFTGKHLFWSFFLITLLVFRPAALLKRYRSNHQRCFIKRAVLKNFAIFTGKHLCRSRFLLKLQAFRLKKRLKKRLLHRCFSVNLVKFLRTPTLKNTCEQLLLKIL